MRMTAQAYGLVFKVIGIWQKVPIDSFRMISTTNTFKTVKNLLYFVLEILREVRRTRVQVTCVHNLLTFSLKYYTRSTGTQVSPRNLRTWVLQCFIQDKLPSNEFKCVGVFTERNEKERL